MGMGESNADKLSIQYELKKLRTIIQSSSNGIVTIDKDGIISCFNKTALKILGVDKYDVKDSHISDIFEKFRIEKNILKEFNSIYKEKIRYKGKLLIYDFIPLRIDDKLWGATILFQDITSFEKILKELEINRKLSKRLDRTIEYSYDGIYITDGKGKTIRVNESYERITGLKRANLIDRNMKDLVKEGYISKSGSLLSIEKRQTISLNQEFKTGKKALITSRPVFDEKGNIIIVITNVRDVTELYKLKSELQVQEKLAEKYYWEIKELKNQYLDTSGLVVKDKKMLDILYRAKKAAITDITVLLFGESGVGKEVVAKFIHKNSNRLEKPFIKVNCGAIPENLIESELFGYEQGAFTGANKDGKMGLFEVANGGTLFLDEIGELPLNMQVKLLRVLQENEVKRVGGVKSIKIDVRIISATNRDLEKMVKQKLFREDLFYRLNVIPINIPPLRERKQDIIELTRYFLMNINEKYGWNKSLARDVMDAIYDYQWPGNVRELKNVIERITAMSSGDEINCKDLPRKILNKKNRPRFEFCDDIIPIKRAVSIVEKNLLERSYEKYGNVRDAARALDIDPSTFVRKRKKYEK
ncbi:sigma 54-interacting transcriptional regulator [Clostridiisalibacter paucivorans]|uniref:sigma 54-interacting transcriptional regulator n=1 Tax=Clostridiisalibacter paucivorans TaxID=408753 RepID=UPI000B2F936C|nr:sigma 54-interacting transcriptional regulator [Clostridiisalibacter paucivorans]